MQLVFYEEAADLLDVSVGVLKQAISARQILTKAGRKGRNTCLVKEQVMLFTGVNPRTGNKKRLSLESLTASELTEWKRYEIEASGQAVKSIIDVEVVRRVAREETKDLRADIKDDILGGLREAIERMMSHPKAEAIA